MLSSAKILPVFGFLLMLFALIWPAIYNGEPLYFFDTTAYIRGADAGFQKATGVSTPWSLDEGSESSSLVGGEAQAPPPAGLNQIRDQTVISGRSVYYGAFLYLGDLIGGFWLTIIAQALLLLLAIALCFRAFEIPLGLPFVVAVIALSLTTSVSFFVSFLMPDVFAALVILACASLIGAKKALRTRDYLIWLVLLAASLTFHATHLLVAAMMLALALLWNLATRSWANRRGLAVIGTCIAVAVVAELAFGWSVKHFVGVPPVRPPFLMARLIADGPGYRYLKCPQSGFQVCDFVNRLPMPADDFTWLPTGVFVPSPPQVRRQLSAEQYQFALAVLLHEPLGVVTSAASNAVREFFSIGLSEFDRSDLANEWLTAKLPPQYRARFRASAQYNGFVPARTWSAINVVIFWFGVVTLALILFASGIRKQFGGPQLNLAALILIGVIINAAVCGIISGPHDRYQARVAWLVPFAAIALRPRRSGCARWRRRSV